MTKIYTLFLSLVATGCTFAQNPLPNPSFENWSSNNTLITDWLLSKAERVSPGVTGSYAAKCEKTSQFGATAKIEPIGTFPITPGRYKYLNFYYKFNPLADAKIFVTLELTNQADNVCFYMDAEVVTTAASAFTPISIPITYTSVTDTAVKCFLRIAIATGNINTTVTPGSYMIIDEMSLTETPVTTPLAIENQLPVNWSVYPNPAQSFLQIRMNETSKNANVQILDVTGLQLLSHPLNAALTSLDISNLPSGVCFITVTADNAIETKKIIIQH